MKHPDMKCDKLECSRDSNGKCVCSERWLQHFCKEDDE